MRVTKWGEYAILFCIYLAKRGKGTSPIGAAEMGRAYDIPTQYAQQILHRLRRGNIITSIRGPHGGFKLCKSAEETNLKEILLASEGATFEIMCENGSVFSGCSSPDFECGLKSIWGSLQETINNALSNISLRSIADKHRLPTPKSEGVLITEPETRTSHGSINT